MNSTKKIMYVCALFSSFMMLSSDTPKSLSNYIQRRNQKTKDRRDGSAAIREKRENKPWLRENPPAKRRVTQTLAEVASDAIWINLGLISWDSLKIFVTTAPFFVGARMIDEKLHNCFFDQRHKKNRYEPAQWVKETARLSIGIPITLLGLQAVFSRNDDMQLTSQIFLTGMPFVLLAKDFIKQSDFDVCKRPFHEKFAKHQRKFGGFPSGHLAEATYTAVLYGMRYGPNFAIPLGGVAVFVSIIFLSSNRHYLSQMIAGAGFGAMYAFSANRLIDSRLAKKRDFNLGLTRDDYGNPAMQLSMKF
ncbi:MAG TPA: phosphatase PAP2 family protein [Candidatus Babeliales bacterium]|nr:phosphatase PAP2 family protein [Candidatus Babeliales bacterium]